MSSAVSVALQGNVTSREVGPPVPEVSESADAGETAGAAQAGDRVLTIPNGISVARLLGVPLFLWLVLGPRTATADAWAVGVLIVSAISDWLDGKIARALGQESRLGQVLDPAADRLYIAATLIGLAVRGIIGWWLVGLLAARELAVGVALAALRRRGFGTLQVSFVGKAATLCVLYAFPLLFLGAHAGDVALVTRVTGWAFAIWGTALYWWAAALYLVQARQVIAGARHGEAASQQAPLAQSRRPGDDGA